MTFTLPERANPEPGRPRRAPSASRSLPPCRPRCLAGRRPGWPDGTPRPTRSRRGRPELKITAVRLERLRLALDPPFLASWDPVPRDHFDATLVRVETDEGLVGVGSGDTMAGFDGFADLFVGTDPLRIARHARVIESLTGHAGRYWPLEAALWDIVGQAYGVPVAALFGNHTRRLPAYASTGELRSGPERVESALAVREQGFAAMKLRLDHGRLTEGLSTVRAVREALGDSLALVVDLNQSWRMPGDLSPSLDPRAAARTVQELAELGVSWVEEPLRYADLAGLAALRSSASVPIAGGEMLPSFDAALACLDRDAFDVYQPDCVLTLGMSGVRTFAELAMRRNRSFTPHTWTNGIGLLANLHVAAGVGAAPFVEYPLDPPGWTPFRRDFMLAEPVGVASDGFLEVPSTPGLGVTLADNVGRRWGVG